jgi:hypothetical protein
MSTLVLLLVVLAVVAFALAAFHVDGRLVNLVAFGLLALAVVQLIGVL